MDQEFESELRNKIDTKTKPQGALGRIEELALQIGMLQHSLTPKMEDCRLTIFAGDHGIANEGVSAFPQEVTAQMVRNFLGGGAAANVFASCLGVELRVVDAGIATPIDHPNLTIRRFGAGTGNSCKGPAMTSETLLKVLETGKDRGAAGNVQAVCFGEMGIGNTASSSLVAQKITGLPLEQLVGRGTGLGDDALNRKIEILQKAASRTGKLSPHEALHQYGGFEIAMITGAMIGAAQQERLVIVDGFIASVAALCALEIAPDIRPALVFSHCSAESGHRIVLDHIGVKPLLDLGLRLGEGTGALLTWPLIKASVAMLNDMASFENAAVSGAI